MFHLTSLPVPAMVGFLLCAALFPLYIKYLRSRQIGQFIREEGPASHAAKAATPTMGGACFALTGMLVAAVCMGLSGTWQTQVVLTMAIALCCGLVGLVDDLCKLQKKANAGVSGRLRLVLEAGLGLMLGIIILAGAPAASISFAGVNVHDQVQLVLPALLYVLFTAFLMAATTNAVNLHDGMDGLAAGTSIQILATLAVMLSVTGQDALSIVAAAAAGSVAGFLLFNHYPAKIFMGDTGSLFLGGLIAALAIAGHLEVFFIPLTLIYIVETLSVIAQVLWFKLTKPYPGEEKLSPVKVIWIKLTRKLPGEGRRLFRMAPLHHHFEAVAADQGIAEWKVVRYFWLAQFVICLLVLTAFFAL